MDSRAWVSVLGIYVLDAFALLALGLIVLYMQPHDRAAQALFWFCTDLGLYIATATDLFGPSHFRIPYFFFINLIPAAVFNLLSHFPVGRERRPRENTVVAGLVALGVVLGSATNLSFWGNRDRLLLLDFVTHTLLAITGLSAIVFFCWHFVRARSRIVRDRTLVVLLGTVSAFILPAVMLAVVYWRDSSVPLNFLTVFFVLFPIAIGYAIAKHDLFNVDRVIKRTIVYFTLSAFVFGVYTITIGTVDYLFENISPVASRLAEGFLILVLILITAPSRARIQDLVDRVYDRRRYNYRDVVSTSSRAFATILDFEKLVLEVLSLIDRTLQPAFVSVYTVDGNGAAYRRGYLEHRSGEEYERRVEADARPDATLEALTHALAFVDFVLVEEDVRHAETVGAAACEALQRIDGALATPMRLEGRLVGSIVVGTRRAGSHYTADDVELLRTISDQLAVALQNAQAYRTIDELNQNLAANYTELEHANRELQETQAQLVQKERLAAIGELSGAVAHAIRNPLAGIKAAAQLALLELEGAPASGSVQDVVSETDRLNDRITALLDFAKPFEPVTRSVTLAEIATRALRSAEHKAHDKGVEVSLQSCDVLPAIMVDPVLLEEATAELISNAIDLTPRAGQVIIRTGCARNGSGPQVWLEVSDTGPGIRADKRDKLFDLFFTTKAGGTGFGLATVKKIVERHGGTVTADNRPEGGACFRIVLPAESAPPSCGSEPV